MVRFSPGDFRISVATSCEVVLVRFIDELDDASPSYRVKRLKRDGHIERGKICFDTAHLGLQLRTFRSALVEACAIKILSRKGDGFKVARSRQCARVICVIVG